MSDDDILMLARDAELHAYPYPDDLLRFAHALLAVERKRIIDLIEQGLSELKENWT